MVRPLTIWSSQAHDLQNSLPMSTCGASQRHRALAHACCKHSTAWIVPWHRPPLMSTAGGHPSPVSRYEQQLPRLQHKRQAPDSAQLGPGFPVWAVQVRHGVAIVCVVPCKGVHAMVGVVWSNQQYPPTPAHLRQMISFRCRILVTGLSVGHITALSFQASPTGAWQARHSEALACGCTLSVSHAASMQVAPGLSPAQAACLCNGILQAAVHCATPSLETQS